MVLKDLNLLYDISIEGYEFGAALDYMGHIMKHPRYMNAGVLLLNMKEIMKTGLFHNALELIMTKKMMFPDQDALNRLGTKKLFLERRFNEQRKITNDTVVKHFCKGVRFFPYFVMYNIKQWDIERVHSFLKIYDFDDIYMKYEEIISKYKV